MVNNGDDPPGGQQQPEESYSPPQAIHEMLSDRHISEYDVEYIYPCPPGQAEFLHHAAKEGQRWVVTAVRPFAAHHSVGEYVDFLQRVTELNDILRST